MTNGQLQRGHGQLVVRRVHPDDVALFRAVRLAALEDSPDAFGETLERARGSDWTARTTDGCAFSDRAIYLAVVGDVSVGMVFAKCGISPEPAFLGGMWVQHDLRRHGVGRSLVQCALDFLRDAGQTEVSLWVTHGHHGALTFYRSLGFRDTGATSSLRAGSDVTIQELRYLLPAVGAIAAKLGDH